MIAHYKEGEGYTHDENISILGKHGGNVYGGIQYIRDFERVYGVEYSVEDEVKENGTLDRNSR
ncbi:hypothetical protein, partial [Bacillus cereus]|uniref:hypothetical protein n=1 Tax=Bacillus cereus TaxID=1396 RepID=UPI002852D81A